MAFELLGKGIRRETRDPAVRISVAGLITLNRAATDAMNGTRRVHVLWDRQSGRFGLRPAAEGDEDSFSLCGGRAFCRSAMRRIGFMVPGIATSVLIPVALEDGILVGAIPETSLARRGERR